MNLSSLRYNVPSYCDDVVMQKHGYYIYRSVIYNK